MAVCKLGRGCVTSVAKALQKEGLLIRLCTLSELCLRRDMATTGLNSDRPAMTLNLVSTSYLEESTAKIRVKQVPWEVRLRPDNISIHHLSNRFQVGISTRRTYYLRRA